MLSRTFKLQDFADGTRIVCDFVLDGKTMTALVDTGASGNFFCSSTVESVEKNMKDYIQVVGFTNHKRRMYGAVPFTTDVIETTFSNFYFADLEHLQVNCVFGMPFLIANSLDVIISKMTKEKQPLLNLGKILVVKN